MITERHVSFEGLAVGLERFANELVPLLGVALKNGVARQLFLFLPIYSPVGNPAVDDHPGKYRASHTMSIGAPLYRLLPNLPSYPIPGAPEADAVLSSSTIENLYVPIFIADAAADDGRADSYAAILELGRHVDSLGRLAGSEQAPEGVYIVALGETIGRRVTIEQQAISAVESLF